MLVTIVAVPNADNTGLDLDRLEKVEDLPNEIARDMVDHGTARIPSDEELAAYREAQPTYATGGEVAAPESGSGEVSAWLSTCRGIR